MGDELMRYVERVVMLTGDTEAVAASVAAASAVSPNSMPPPRS